MSSLSRRAFLMGASATGVAFGLAGCVTNSSSMAPLVVASAEPAPPPPEPVQADGTFDYKQLYAAAKDDKFPIPAVDLKRINPAFLRAEIDYDTSEAPGTIIIDTKAHYLYHVGENGRAMRYGVGVGREGFVWAGTAQVHSKQEWPDWYPPSEMIQRQPELKAVMSKLQSGIGMHGGPRNPLGARAMYLWQNNKDTLFRIHGTIEPWSVGHSVSSGCIRMINQDVMDLYQRVAVGSKVIVQGPGMSLEDAEG
ncbi:L,D-transpeptidase [Labrys monachus]|uniref:Lipoprotein-anchoring transpeptidase ErfK/SrfK n=1 Tax=Labrys monachus TaxID=217067 RepID=A0ABU0FJD5_9HYPH|nr:L,D-transpeptidase [Labrys monachus]MDQ0394722.1 lipoprotein-anchoring transpeptidase ErfK/SrfK [Labrys monachus]